METEIYEMTYRGWAQLGALMAPHVEFGVVLCAKHAWHAKSKCVDGASSAEAVDGATFAEVRACDHCYALSVTDFLCRVSYDAYARAARDGGFGEEFLARWEARFGEAPKVILVLCHAVGDVPSRGHLPKRPSDEKPDEDPERVAPARELIFEGMPELGLFGPAKAPIA